MLKKKHAISWLLLGLSNTIATQELEEFEENSLFDQVDQIEDSGFLKGNILIKIGCSIGVLGLIIFFINRRRSNACKLDYSLMNTPGVSKVQNSNSLKDEPWLEAGSPQLIRRLFVTPPSPTTPEFLDLPQP